MSGTTTSGKDVFGLAGGLRDLVVNFNKLVDDLNTVRLGTNGIPFAYVVENLAAGADITERAIFRYPVAITVADCVAIHEAATTVNGGSTAVITLRNITAGADVATVTLVADNAANSVSTVTIANADCAANDVLGVIVTQSASADLGKFTLLFRFSRLTLDTSGDLLAAKIGNDQGVAISA